MKQDYYGILGLSKGAAEKDIKAAYRKLARKHHPDVNPNDPQAEQRFKEINEAYQVLSDPEKRKLYDRYGSNWEAAQQGRVQPGGEGFGGFNFDVDGPGVDGMGDLFEKLFGFGGDGGFTFGRPQPIEPRDVERVVEVTLDEIDSGTKRAMTYQVEDACSHCSGSGQVRLQTGSVGVCPTCRGNRMMPRTRKVEVKIPAGIHDGKKLRIPGGGATGSNGRAGDLYVVVKELPHAMFKRKGEDLETEIAVPYTLAALGGEVRVPTLHGSVRMRVPEGSQSGRVFRLGGQGISRLGGGKGNLLARLKITVPEHLSPRQRELLQELQKLEAAPV